MIKKLLFLILILFSYTGFSQLVINELDSDTPGVDNLEFIEIKSATPNFSLNGYIVVLFNGSASGGNKSYYTINLSGYTTDVNGIFLLGNNAVSPVPGLIFPSNTIQNGEDAIAIYHASPSAFPFGTIATTNNLVDALVYGNSNPDAVQLMALLGVTQQIDENINGLGTIQSIQRNNDGTYTVAAPTPGANNDGSGVIFNGITISTNASQTVTSLQVNEGSSLDITFTAQTNVTTDTAISFTLNNDTFNESDFTGNTTVVIPAESNTATATIQIIDDTTDEGDEILIIKLGTLPSGFVSMNNNIEIRVVDNDFTVSAWGTPLNPTYGMVTPAIPAGYYDSLEGLTGVALKQAVQDIIANPAVVRAHTYGDVTDILKSSDQNPLNSNQVWLIYTEEGRAKLDFQTTSSNVGSWNREHIYPQSRGGFSNGTSSTADGINIYVMSNANDTASGHSDAHAISAVDGPENSSRGNRDYGVEYNGPAGNAGSWKGDVARAVFFMAVRYNALDVVNGNPSNTTVGQLGDLATLLTWNAQDTSDDFEMNRNNVIYNWQMNRNPFIDYPNLADYIWGTQVGNPWSATLNSNIFTSLEVVLYPNPAQDYINIKGLSQESEIHIYNMNGMKVLEKQFIGDTTLYLNLPSGIYMSNIISGNHSVTRKIIIK